MREMGVKKEEKEEGTGQKLNESPFSTLFHSHLVDLALSREERNAREDLRHHAADGPHVHLKAVAATSMRGFRI